MISTPIPARLATRAASSLLVMPPVPPLEVPAVRASASSSTRATSAIRSALGSVFGLAV